MACQTLHGSCACGRYRYVVEVPSQQAQQAEVRYDNTPVSRQHSASPLTLWLRVPLPWLTSATFAQYPDETRSSIQRSFVSPFAAHAHRRQFCGYCGTQLSSWNERTRDEAEHICLTVGSLLDDDQALLAELGLLPWTDGSDDHGSSGDARSRTPARSEAQARGAPWFEQVVRDTGLGRLKQQRGAHAASRVQVEWEVMEWTEDDDDDADDAADGHAHGAPSGKRKIGDMDATDDTAMRT